MAATKSATTALVSDAMMSPRGGEQLLHTCDIEATLPDGLLAMYKSLLPRGRRICMVRRRCARFHDDLDARILFVTERPVHRRGIFQTDAMRDDE